MCTPTARRMRLGGTGGHAAGDGPAGAGARAVRRAPRLVADGAAGRRRPAAGRVAAAAQARRAAARPDARWPLRGRSPANRGLRNVVARIPGRRPGIVSVPTTTRSSSPRASSEPTTARPGARSSSSSAGRFAKLPRPRDAREVTFVLFDGEEPASGLAGGRPGLRQQRAARVARVRARPTPTAPSQMILLDYVGNRGLRLPREATSDVVLWSELRPRLDRRRAGGVP